MHKSIDITSQAFTFAQQSIPHALRGARKLCAGGACSQHTSTRTHSDERPADAADHRARCIGSAASCCSSSWQRWQRILCDLACTSACSSLRAAACDPSLITYSDRSTATDGGQSTPLDTSRPSSMCVLAGGRWEAAGARENWGY